MDQPCLKCGGEGAIATPDGKLYQICPACNGSGKDEGVQVFCAYPWDLALTANQILPNQRVVVDGDAEFIWKALVSTQQNPFRIKLYSGPGTGMTQGGAGAANDLLNNGNCCGTAEFPFPIIPHVVIPRAGVIAFDIEERGGGGNIVQLGFIGAKRYPTPR